MAIPAKPEVGQTLLPFIQSQEMWSGLLEMLVAYKNGDFSRGKQAGKKIVTPRGKNSSGAELAKWTVQQLGDPEAPGSNEESVLNLHRYKPTFALSDPVWHTAIDKLAVVPKNIRDGSSESIRSGRYVPMGLGLYSHDPKNQWAWVDPDDPTRAKVGTGGAWKIIGKIDEPVSLTVILDTQQSQPLWRYELTADVTGAGDAPAKLLNLDDTTFADSIQLTFPDEVGQCLKSGDKGYCLNVGNEFHALTTAAALLGAPQTRQLQSGPLTPNCANKTLCFDQGSFAASVFPTNCDLEETDPLPKSEVFCLDQSLFDCLDLCGYICEFCDAYSNDPDCNPPPPDCCGDCEFPDDAIAGLVLFSSGTGTYRQSGPSTKTDECCFSVPVELDGSAPAVATVCYDGAGTWSASGPWGTVSGPGGCSGSVPLADGEPPTWDGYMDVTGTTCDDPPPPPCGTCDWTWDDAGQDWVLASNDCVNNCVCVKPTYSGTTDLEPATTDCEEGPPCGTCDWTWDGTGMKWDLISDGCTNNCECVEPPTAGTSDGEEATTECVLPPGICCDYGGDAYIEGFSAANGSVTATQINNLDPIVSSGPCSASATIALSSFDGQNQGGGSATVTLRYDTDCPGCVWDVEITGTTLPGGDADGTGVASSPGQPAVDCVGNFDTTALCGDNDAWDQRVLFDVFDPTDPPGCVDPNAALRIVRTSRQSEGRIARALRSEAPELFTGRSCTTRDIMKLMDAWGVEKSAKDIDRVADEFLTSLKSSRIESHRGLEKPAVKQIVLNVLRKLQ